ncbi:MAG TPA: UvrD-helicase domain-containing protein, partial [Longimicrobium sp.]|nr:UvrD-helicase domain-containing protein [Longimicrobium sp.]
MSHWTELRARAREQHRVLLGLTGGDASAAALLRAAAEMTDVHPKRLASGDPLLDGALAVLDRDAELIYYDRDTDPAILPLLLAHEYAHGWLEHGDCARCTAEQIDPEASDEDVPLGTAQVQGYSPEERREREANVYARELLLPSDTLCTWYLDVGLGASAIAARTGLPDGMVLHQLSHALLTPEAAPAARPAEEGKAPLPDLDPSQREAAFEPEGPVLTEAGPGTGKTRTLVARVGYLLDRGEEAGSILGLTFSIKAAEEMRERIARIAPVEAAHMVIGTFHSFGLEVLRKYGHHLNYPKRLRVLDPASALFMMERMLPALGLVHYQNLYEPTLSLRDLLDAISRAKDELRTPDEYDVLARAMREKAADEEQVERAERALEVARVYRVYQDRLDGERMVDFGDLIFRTVELLRTVPAVRTALANEFRNILVDEYQDV